MTPRSKPRSTGRARRGHPPAAHCETWLSGPSYRGHRGPGVLNVAVCYPAAYPLGMSNLGFQTVLGLFMEEPEVACERAFWDPDAPAAGRSEETRTLLSQFDVVAFSVSFEDDLLNLVSVLDAAGIPPESADRGVDDPLVVMGGVCAYLNPEPVAPFVDAVLVGEAEAIVGPFVESVISSRGLSRSEQLAELARLPGAYVPSLYTVEREPDGSVVGFTVREPAMLPVSPAVGPATLPASVVLSDGAFFSDMLLLETSRGCARGCRFCAAGSVLEPRRHRPLEDIVRVLESSVEHGGRVGLVTAALLDHPDALEILRAAERLGVEVNVSSLRADAITSESARLLAAVGVRTATVAPETASEDLRRILGKPISDAGILEAARLLAEGGVGTLKLYFMLGVPGETDADVEAIPEFALRVREVFTEGRPRARVSVSVSSFVPKPRTPFQWLPMAGEGYLRDKVSLLRKTFASGPRIEFSAAGPREARREGALARGGRELAGALLLAALEDVPWKSALKRSGVDVAGLLDRERSDDEVFPWELIRTGPDRKRLLASLATARRLMAERQ